MEVANCQDGTELDFHDQGCQKLLFEERIIIVIRVNHYYAQPEVLFKHKGELITEFEPPSPHSRKIN